LAEGVIVHHVPNFLTIGKGVSILLRVEIFSSLTLSLYLNGGTDLEHMVEIKYVYHL